MTRRVTIVDVAHEAGVAISTVSAALNGRPGVAEATRTRVVEVAERMGWVPSMQGRSLSSRKTFSVGIVIQRDPRILEADPFFWGFLGGVEEVLDARGYALVLQTAPTADRALDRVRELALARGVDGLFLTDVRADDARLGLVQDLGLPAVAVNLPPEASPVPTAGQDHEVALRELLRLLVAEGHRRIAHVAGAPDHVHTVQRENVWRTELAAAGLRADLVVPGDFTTDCGTAAAHHLMALADPPTAVVCANDLTALGFLAGVRSMGLDVPSDVSITGFDGIPMGQFCAPPLTSVQTSPHELGTLAAQVLLAAIDGEPRRDASIAPATLLVRESVGAPPAAKCCETVTKQPSHPR